MAYIPDRPRSRQRVLAVETFSSGFSCGSSAAAEPWKTRIMKPQFRLTAITVTVFSVQMHFFINVYIIFVMNYRTSTASANPPSKFVQKEMNTLYREIDLMVFWKKVRGLIRGLLCIYIPWQQPVKSWHRPSNQLLLMRNTAQIHIFSQIILPNVMSSFAAQLKTHHRTV